MSKNLLLREGDGEERLAKYGQKEVKEFDLLFQEIVNGFIVE